MTEPARIYAVDRDALYEWGHARGISRMADIIHAVVDELRHMDSRIDYEVARRVFGEPVRRAPARPLAGKRLKRREVRNSVYSYEVRH